MSVHPISFALVATLLAAVAAQGQQLVGHSPWVPDPRLAPVFAPVAHSTHRAPASLLPTPMSRNRHAIVSVLAGAMVGTAIGLLESTNVRKGCSVPEPGSICSVRESSDRPIVIGALLGATMGFLYHLSRR
jgi:hypothetical protein